MAMPEIFINLKRFDVSKKYGGLCPVDDPIHWIENVIDESVKYELGTMPGIQVYYLLPEGLISAAANKLHSYPKVKTRAIAIGCQGVHWDDISPGGNFGAFTTSLPASAAKSLGCSWAIIGHSEERKSKLQIITTFEPSANQNNIFRRRASQAINELINAEVVSALNVGLNVLLCIGESAEERGEGEFSEQQTRIESVLKSQLISNLKYVNSYPDQIIVIGYEPIWAIGPGKTPPGKEYIGFVSRYIVKVVKENFGFKPVVVYGGGLKEENAGMIASIDSIGGGLVALTRFTGDIGFDVLGLKGIIEKYLS
jgi:triosephosphate isomerase